MANRYTKALKQLKSKSIDEKLELLSEIPTNSSGGLYVDVPGVYTTPPITSPIGVTGTPVDLDQDGDGSDGYNGQDTTGLFKEDGTVLTVIPPGDNSYILGPMISMWYAWANYTQIGYVRQSDRKMVNLGRITGELDDWDGSSGFTSYGQMSLEQAVWYKGQSRQDYRAFYPGPPSNPADEFGRYTGSIVNESRFPNTTRQPSVAHTPGTQRGPDSSDDLAALLNKRRLEDEDKSDELMRTIMNAAMLGLDILAVLAVLFPEPGSSAAGAAHLATKLRYVAKLRRMRGALNPFGQRAVRSGAAGRRRVPVYSGRPYQGKRGFGKTTYGTTDPKTAATYSNPGPLKGTPGTGSRVNPRGTVDTGTLPQRYIDKYGSRSVLGQRQIKLGQKAAKRTFGEDYEYIQEQIKIYKLLEAAQTASGNVGGMEAADGYVDQVAQNASPEQLEKASNDANNIAKEGGQGVSDAELEQIDKDVEAEVKRITANINISDPESMNDDQLFDAFEFMYESNQDLTMELSDQFVDLIDRETLDVAFKEFSERKEYLSSDEFYRSVAPEYFRYKARADYLYDTFMSRVYTIPTDDALGFSWQIDGRYLERGEYDLIHEWSDNWKRQYDTYNNKIWPEKKRQLKLNEEKYAKIADAAFRPHFVAVINAWNIMFRSSLDPYALDEPVPHDLMGDLALLGISYGVAIVLIKALGAAKVGLLMKSKAGLTKIKNWWNQGRNVRVPGENQASWKDLRIDDKLQGSKFVKPGSRWKDPKNLTDADFEGGAIPTNLDQLGQLLQGKGGFTWQLTRGLKTGPTALTRQLIERPFRTILKFFESSDLKGNILTEETSSQKALYDALDAALKETDPKDFGKVIDTFLAMIEDQISKKKAMESYQPNRPKFLQQRGRQPIEEVVTSKQKRILREIKKPFEIKEAPTKFKVKPTGRKNKSVGVDMMKIPDVPNQYKPPAPSIWSAKDRDKNIRASQEKKNEVLELVGAAEHHWTYLTEQKRKAHQEKVNEMMSAEFDKHLELMYENHKIKEERVNKAIKAVKRSSDLAPEYPETPPPPPDPETGMHPKYGKRYKHDKLDPHSAEAMPPTGDPVIDANVKKATDAKRKARKLKVLMGKTKKG